MIKANANPSKRFFVDMFVRDAALEDVILDLIDNCIDGYSREFNVKLSSELLNADNHNEMRDISISYNPARFTISDNCGGIDFHEAENNIFRLGRSETHSHSGLSVYGIGLKRAMFKIGKKVEMTSRTTRSGFRMTLNVEEWMKDEDPNKPINWHFPLEKIDPVTDPLKAGTKLVITDLRPEISARFSDGSLQKRVINFISSAYPFFLDRHLNITLNKNSIEGKILSFSQSKDLTPGYEKWEDDGVLVELLCGVRPKDDPDRGFWKHEYAGWYLVCNGRVVVTAEKSSFTGWGISGELPQFQPKHRGFLGIVFFSSDNPEALPWKTTKQGINNESLVYLHTRAKMVIHGKKVIRLLDSMYQSNDDNTENPSFRGLITNETDSVPAKPFADNKDKSDSPRLFEFKKPSSQERPQTTRVQYDANQKDLDKIRVRLKKRSMPAKSIGEYTFKYFLEKECPE
jgi:hypothetical protein